MHDQNDKFTKHDKCIHQMWNVLVEQEKNNVF